MCRAIWYGYTNVSIHAGATAGLPSSAKWVPGFHCWTSQTVAPSAPLRETRSPITRYPKTKTQPPWSHANSFHPEKLGTSEAHAGESPEFCPPRACFPVSVPKRIRNPRETQPPPPRFGQTQHPAARQNPARLTRRVSRCERPSQQGRAARAAARSSRPRACVGR